MSSNDPRGAPAPDPLPLDFSLPPFMRESWTSAAAAGAYRDRLRELSTLLLAATVADLDADAVLCRRIPGYQVFALRALASEHGFDQRCHVVRDAADPEPQRPGLLRYDVYVGRAALLSRLERERALTDPERHAMPACCARAARDRLRGGAGGGALWQLAAATPSAERRGLLIALAGKPWDNPLLHCLGLRVASHLPCSLDCELTQRGTARVLARGLSGPRRADFELLCEVLAWPALWSALHGIAELRLPVVRIATHCAATANRCEIRWQGTQFPALGARGLRFPYREPESRAPTRVRGLDQPATTPSELVTLRILPPRLRAPSRYADPRLDWARLATPQDDGYDTEVALRLSGRNASYGHAWPHLAQGRVAVRPSSGGLLERLGWCQAELEGPQLEAAMSYLRAWPAAYAQFCELIDVLHPVQDAVSQGKEGSSSHHLFNQRGHIWATTFDSLGLAQALVHELAHTKLFDLGLAIESDHHLIVNPRGQLFQSPIRKDRPRPMSAVFHAQYSFMYVVALDLQLLRSDPEPELRTRIERLLERNVSRMEQGFELLARQAQLDARGAVFFKAFMGWSERLLRDGRAALAAAA